MKKVTIIAEAGVNHNGSIRLAKQLVDAASDAGADYVKFQTFKAEQIASAHATKASYQQANTGNDEGQLAMLKKLELNEQDHLELIDYCADKNIRFLSTPFDLESIDLLKQIGITLGKIPSGEITNLPYLRKMAAAFPELIMSTGMASMEEIGEALNVLLDGGADRSRIKILHCNTEYPTPFSDVNLLAMPAIGKTFGVEYGYSDHTNGIEVPIAAVALGAVLIEKHFTLDRNMEGPDHKASLEPDELKQMVASIRNIEIALGSAEKKPSSSEARNKVVARKSIVAAVKIAQGEVFSSNNLAVKRPGTGISPMHWDQIIGQRASRNFEPDELIEL
ncbi:MAG TPA: N-acetylneuraminate synthase [Chitinophagaceae bacterium]